MFFSVLQTFRMMLPIRYEAMAGGLAGMCQVLFQDSFLKIYTLKHVFVKGLCIVLILF